MPLTPGTRFGAYEIVASIGSGGMGEVYRAHDARLHRDVAIKVLPEHSCNDREAVARFQREAQAASALNHPHILTIYEIGSAPRDYIAMEYISGETLRDHIARDRDITAVLDLLIQIADALARAHEANIVHRDLKPDNIMVTSDGYAKILDFGLAKLVIPSPAEGEESPPQVRGGSCAGREMVNMFTFVALRERRRARWSFRQTMASLWKRRRSSAARTCRSRPTSR